ncbi:MAG: SHOCT domain-containing protein [Pseudomonadota bacterium]
MTAMLNELRALEARYKQGDLSAVEYAAEKTALLYEVEEAQTDFAEPAPRPARRKTGSTAFGFSIVICLLVMGLCLSLTLLFLPNINLALTLGVTILAALCVALMQEKEEE